MLALQVILNMLNHLLEMLKLWSEVSLMLIHVILNTLKPLLEIPKLRSEPILILVHHMSYSLNSIAYFIICLDKFVLCNVTRNGWFVKTVIWWAWKYGQKFLAAICNARVVCSTWEYHISTSIRALLM